MGVWLGCYYVEITVTRKEGAAMKKKVTISLDEEIVEKLKELAEGSHRNVSQWITDKVLESEKDKTSGKENQL